MPEKPAAGVGRGDGRRHDSGEVLAARVYIDLGSAVEVLIGGGVVADELNGHKKTVSESETVAGQYPE